LKINM